MTGATGAAGHVLGIGVATGGDPHDAIALVDQCLSEAGIARDEVRALATIDARAEDPAVLAVADALGCPLLVFSAARLEVETPRLANPSERVFRATGCHGVAESASLAATGPDAVLVMPKRKTAKVTLALAFGRF